MPASTSTKKKRRTRSDKKDPVVEAKAAEVIGSLTAKADFPEKAEVPEPEKAVKEEKVDDDGGKVVEQPIHLPKHLTDRMAAAMNVVEDVQEEVRKFKEHPDFCEGNMPGTLYGLKGNSNILGGRSLCFIDPDHIDPTTHVHWSNKRMVDWHRGQGYETFDHDRFTDMVTSYGGTYSYGKTVENHVSVGDLILMRTSRDHYEAREQAKQERTRTRERKAKNFLYQKGQELGVEVYERDVGPKLTKIVDMLKNELGHEGIERLLNL